MATKRSTRASEKIKEALQQYSKKMCTKVAFFWGAYRVIVLAIVFFKPETATAIIRLTEGVDTVMIINMSVYTANSTVEKVSLAYFGKRFKDELEDTDDAKTQEDKIDEAVEEGIQNG